MKRLPLLSTLASILLTAAAACDKEQPPPPAATGDAAVAEKTGDAGQARGPKIIYEEGPQPTPDTVVAHAGDFQVTVEDFDRSVRRGRLFAPRGADGTAAEVPKERLALPHLQLTMSNRLLERKIMMSEIERRGIEISEEEIHEFIRKDSALSRLRDELDDPEKLAKTLAKIDLEPADLFSVARQQIARKKLRDVLLEEITPEQIWERYKQRNNTVRLAVASTSNVPTSDEITQFVEENPDRIETYFEENSKEFRQPTLALVDVVRPAADTEVKPSVLEDAAARLKRGEAPEEVARALGLQAKTGVHLIKQENRAAFRAEVGESGYETAGPRGAYAWVVRGKRTSQKPEMDRPLRREVAATILRREGVTPSAEVKIRKALELFREKELGPQKKLTPEERQALKEQVEALGLEFLVTDRFPRAGNGFVPGIGLAEELVERAFELSRKRPVPKDPVLSREKVYAIALLDRERPSKKEFREKKEEIRREYIREISGQIVDSYLAGIIQSLEPQIDTTALRVKYGVIRKSP